MLAALFTGIQGLSVLHVLLRRRRTMAGVFNEPTAYLDGTVVDHRVVRGGLQVPDQSHRRIVYLRRRWWSTWLSSEVLRGPHPVFLNRVPEANSFRGWRTIFYAEPPITACNVRGFIIYQEEGIPDRSMTATRYT